jgi:hypothetical protein
MFYFVLPKKCYAKKFVLLCSVLLISVLSFSQQSSFAIGDAAPNISSITHNGDLFDLKKATKNEYSCNFILPWLLVSLL